mmetsp:Transcript_4464/g.11088  ORF Transcript_4464/g.11088 Transcript_4464/m.11088 type:complete len:158 (+) Transcript_4464:1-474(+)
MDANAANALQIAILHGQNAGHGTRETVRLELEAAAKTINVEEEGQVYPEVTSNLIWHNREYKGVSFDRMHFQGVKMFGCIFTGCSFDRANFYKCNVYNCVFIDCSLKDILGHDMYTNDVEIYMPFCVFTRCVITPKVTMLCQKADFENCQMSESVQH